MISSVKSVIAGTSKQTDKTTLESKRKLLTDSTDVLLLCGLFLDLLDIAKKFSLVSQKENFGIIELDEELDDMFLAYYLMKRRFERNSESMILEALTERFGALSEENDHGEDKSGTAIADDSILRDVFRVLDSRKWIVPEGMAITLEAIEVVLEKNIESLSKVFDHYMFKKISPAITIEAIIDEYISLVMYTMKNFNHLIHTPLKMWQLLNPFKNELGWNSIFLIAELCFCAPCLNPSLKRFFSQMRIVKTDWRNSLSESNLTSLLRIKVSGPTLEVFVDKYCAKVVNNWYHEKDRRIKPRKKYRKRKTSKPPRKEFQLRYLFETSSESEEEEEEEDVTIL